MISPWIIGLHAAPCLCLSDQGTQKTTDFTTKDWGKEGIKYFSLCYYISPKIQESMESLLSPPLADNVFIETNVVVFSRSGY